MATSPIATYTNQKLEPFQNPDLAREIQVRFAAGVANIPKGTILGEITASPGVFRPYASGNVDGSQNPRAIARYDMQIDGAGLITLSPTAAQSGGDRGEKHRSAPAFVRGDFRTTDLVGLDATALTNSPQWKLVQGSVADGILAIG
jgi:hypothetical protein